MSSEISNLQKAIVGGNESLTQLLRRTKLIAAKLNLEDVERWVDYELKGYPDGIVAPDYRKYVAQRLEVLNPVRGWEFVGHVRKELRASQPIAEIENFSDGAKLTFPVKENFPISDALDGNIARNWPQRFVFSGDQLKAIVERVKNELLEWTIKLEKRGIKGENMNFDESEKKLAGDVNIGTFNGVWGNVTNSQVAVNDYSSICKLLIDQNIPTTERRELEDILEELKTAPPERKTGLVAKAEEWMVKHRESLGTGAEVVGKFISGLSGHSSSPSHPR